MNAADAGPTPRPAAAASEMAAARVFIADSRLALMALNQLRLMALRRMFGVSREQANALTVVLALTAGDASLRTARRLTHARLSSGDVATGGFLVREATLGIAGPGAREFPYAASLLAGAMLAGIALPELRRAARGIKAAEHRVREQRIRAYSARNRGAAQVPDAA